MAKVNEIDRAKKNFIFKIKIGEKTYNFEQHLFDLSDNNIAELNKQISEIPSQIAWTGQVLGEAEAWLSGLKTAFDLWKSARMSTNDYQNEKSEKAKEQRVKEDFSKEWDKHAAKVTEAEKIVRILKSYQAGVEAKHSLSQTLAANQRAERDSWKKHNTL